MRRSVTKFSREGVVLSVQPITGKTWGILIERDGIQRQEKWGKQILLDNYFDREKDTVFSYRAHVDVSSYLFPTSEIVIAFAQKPHEIVLQVNKGVMYHDRSIFVVKSCVNGYITSSMMDEYYLLQWYKQNKKRILFAKTEKPKILKDHD